MKTYQVNEVFYSLQGEGMRIGTANVFVRLSGCNLTCRADNEAGFDCDTEFVSGRKLSALDIHGEMMRSMLRACPAGIARAPRWCVLTGGEPGLQVDDELLTALHSHGWRVAIETNGTKALPEGIDWVCCSPKSAEHTLNLKHADELKYVRHHGQGIPRPSVMAMHQLISPAFSTRADGSHFIEPGTLEWCIQLVKEDPTWRLSPQMHKLWRVR